MINIKTSRKTLITTVFIHFFIFMALYTIPFFLGHYLFPALSIEGFHFPIERWLIWVVPPLILIKVFEKEIYISLSDMFTHKVKLKTFLWCFLPVLSYLVCGIISAKYFGITWSVRPLREFSSIQDCSFVFAENSWYALVTPAIPEEMVFRAWTLNAFLGKAPTKKQKIIAIILSNILFVAMHLPVYIFVFKYPLINALASFVSIFVIGSIFSIMFLKSKNIILPIFIHCLWDTFTSTFFG